MLSSDFIAENTFNAVQEKNRLNAQQKSNFQTKFSSLEKDEKGNPTINALKELAFEKNSPSSFSASELMQVFTAFRAQKDFQSMVKLTNECTNKEFSDAEIVQEFYIVACNQIGSFDQAITSGEVMVRAGHANGEVFGALGKAWLKKHDAAKAEGNTEEARRCLTRSKNNYRAGFLCDFEYYPGINAAYRMLDLGEFEQAQHIANMVYIACQRDGGRETMDYWCAATMMEAACIMGATKEEIEVATKNLSSMNVEKWQIDSTISMLTRVRDGLEEKGQNTSSFDIALLQMQNLSPTITPTAEKTITSALKNGTFSYRGLASNFIGANFVAGNFKYGGQLPDHCLTRTDWKQFASLLEAPLKDLIGVSSAKNFPPTLKEIIQPEDFLRAADILIRRAFNTEHRNLENMHGEGHSIYDMTVKGLIDLSGTKNIEKVDSRTNISVALGMGLGDCRHHAQAKQLLFDSWQKHHINEMLRSAYISLQSGDIQGYHHELEAAREMESVELRTMDAIVEAPLETRGKYQQVYDESGNLVVQHDGKMNEIEDHTLNLLLRHDSKGNLTSVSFADSFYQNFYQWGEGKIPTDQLHLDEKGTLIIPAKTISAIDPSSSERTEVPVTLRPAPYAGKRDIAAKDEYGRLLLLGAPIDPKFSLVESLTRSERERMKPLDDIYRWKVKRETITPPLQAHDTEKKLKL